MVSWVVLKYRDHCTLFIPTLIIQSCISIDRINETVLQKFCFSSRFLFRCVLFFAFLLLMVFYCMIVVFEVPVVGILGPLGWSFKAGSTVTPMSN